MKVTQITITLPHSSDQVADIAQILAGNGINIRALSLTGEGGAQMLRLLVNDPNMAARILEDSGFPVDFTEVCVVETMDKPGGLASVLLVLQKAEIGVTYLYSFSKRSGETGLVILASDNLDSAIAVLTKYGVRVLTCDEVCSI